jgi:hypothetical protein
MPETFGVPVGDTVFIAEPFVASGTADSEVSGRAVEHPQSGGETFITMVQPESIIVLAMSVSFNNHDII